MNNNTESHDFERTQRGALINKNNDALTQYKKTKKKFARLNDIERLDNEVAELKAMVKQLLASKE